MQLGTSARTHLARGILWLAAGVSAIAQWMPCLMTFRGDETWWAYLCMRMRGWISGGGFPHPMVMWMLAGMAVGTFCTVASPWFMRVLQRSLLLRVIVLVTNAAACVAVIHTLPDEVDIGQIPRGIHWHAAAMAAGVTGLLLMPWGRDMKSKSRSSASL